MNASRRQLAAAAVAALVAAGVGCGGGSDRDRDRVPPGTSPSTTDRRAHVTSPTDAEFEEIVGSADGPVLVLFWAPWSGPDRIVRPYAARAARERPGLTVVEVDVDKAQRTAARYDVLSIPTAMVLVRGRRRGRRVVGALPRERWERELELDEIAPRR